MDAMRLSGETGAGRVAIARKRHSSGIAVPG